MNNVRMNRIVEAMIAHYQHRALLIAMFRINSAHEKGNRQSLVRWQKIADAIEQLQISSLLNGSTVH